MLLIVSASAATSPFASSRNFCFRSPLATAVTTLTMPRTCLVRFEAMTLTLSVRSFQTPDDAGHVGLAAELPLDADFARDRRHLVGEDAERVGHVVDRLGERGDLALRFEDELLAQVAVGDRGDDLDDAAHLLGQVRGHDVHVVGQVLPRARDALDLGLPAELSFGADLLRDARDLRGERVELIDHLVDDVLDLEDLALHVDGDLLRQVAVGDGRRDLRRCRGAARSGSSPATLTLSVRSFHVP